MLNIGCHLSAAKGYMNMGMGRFMFVVILTLMTCIGIVLALLLLGVKYWGFSG